MLRFHPLAPPLALSLAVALSLYLPTASALDATPAASDTLDPITVIAQHLNDARNGIQTQTGASTYVIDEQAIAAEPGGDNQLLNQVIMQAPDVAQDSFGPIPRARRAQRAAIPAERHHSPRRHQRLRPVPGPAPDLLPDPDRRRVAGRIWVAHRRHH